MSTASNRRSEPDVTLEHRVAVWLASKSELEDPSLIRDVTFEASEGRAWSEVTIEEFDCFVRFRYGSEPKTVYLDERDVVVFLNEVWKASVIA